MTLVVGSLTKHCNLNIRGDQGKLMETAATSGTIIRWPGIAVHVLNQTVQDAYTRLAEHALTGALAP